MIGCRLADITPAEARELVQNHRYEENRKISDKWIRGLVKDISDLNVDLAYVGGRVVIVNGHHCLAAVANQSSIHRMQLHLGEPYPLHCLLACEWQVDGDIR